MSGLPGTFLKCTRYPLIPLPDRSFRTTNSGFVSFARIELIVRETLSLFGIGARPSRI